MLFALATGVLPCRAGNKPCLVAIDAGHSESAQGTVSSRGLGEFVFNSNIAQLLLKKIRTDGIAEAFLIEDAGKSLSLRQRTEMANRRHADFLISIHHDSVQPSYLLRWTYGDAEHRYSDRFHGFSLFVSTKNTRSDESFELARYIGSQLLELNFTPTLHHAEKIRGENHKLADTKRGIYIFDELGHPKDRCHPSGSPGVRRHS